MVRLASSRILLFLFVLFFFFPTQALGTTVFKIIGAGLAGASLLSAVMGRRRLRAATVFLLCVVLVGTAGLVGALTFGHVEALYMQKMVLNAVLFVAVAQSVAENRDLKLVLLGIGLGGLMSAISGLVEISGADSSERIAGVLENANGYGQVCVQAGVCLAGLALIAKRKVLRIGAFAASLVCVVGLFHSASRGAALSLATVGLLLVALRAGRRWAAPAAVVVGLLAIQAAPAIFYERLEGISEHRRQNYRSPVEIRLELAKNGWEIFRDNPVAGVGTGNTQRAMKAVETDIIGVTHNVFTQALAETGLLGLAAFAFLALATGIRLLRLAQAGGVAFQERVIALVFLALLAAVTVAQSSSGNYTHAIWYLLFGIGNNLRAPQPVLNAFARCGPAVRNVVSQEKPAVP